MTRPGVFIVDANVLIDYVEVDASVLSVIVDHLGPLHVPNRIMQEIRPDQLDAEGARRLGLTVVIEDVEELLHAAQRGQSGPLSFQDHLVVIMARRRSWTPITNDRSLRTALDREQIPKRWGMEMLIDLVQATAMTVAQAIYIATRIVESNPRYGKKVLSDFVEKVKAMQPPHRRSRTHRGRESAL